MFILKVVKVWIDAGKKRQETIHHLGGDNFMGGRPFNSGVIIFLQLMYETYDIYLHFYSPYGLVFAGLYSRLS